MSFTWSQPLQFPKYLPSPDFIVPHRLLCKEPGLPVEEGYRARTQGSTHGTKCDTGLSPATAPVFCRDKELSE